MHKPTASEELIDQLKLLEPQLNKIYVGSTLKKSIATQNNKYINLLYQDFPANHLSVEYLIHDNYQDLIKRKTKGEKSIVQHHWLQFDNIYSIKPLLIVFISLLIFRAQGGIIVWTLHNKLPHDNPYQKINQWIRRSFAKIATHLHVHCPGVIEEMSRFLKVPQSKFFVVRHPDYPVEIISEKEAWTRARKKYADFFNGQEWDEHDEVYLMYGQIKPYKGIEEVLDMFLAHATAHSKKLLIVGRIKDETYGKEIHRKSCDVANVVFIPKFIPDEDTSLFYGLSQYVVFNYKSILTSGGAIEALNYQKKTIIPNKGCLNDLKGENIVRFDTLDELEKIIFP